MRRRRSSDPPSGAGSAVRWVGIDTGRFADGVENALRLHIDGRRREAHKVLDELALWLSGGRLGADDIALDEIVSAAQSIGEP